MPLPFVDLLYDPARADRAVILAVRDTLPRVVASGLSAIDPAHRVTPVMVDVRVQRAGPDDRLSCPVYVTVLARTEPARQAEQQRFVDEVTDELRAVGLPEGAMVESILTVRTSSYRYGEH